MMSNPEPEEKYELIQNLIKHGIIQKYVCNKTEKNPNCVRLMSNPEPEVKQGNFQKRETRRHGEKEGSKVVCKPDEQAVPGMSAEKGSFYWSYPVGTV
jgi:hypothetical protein